jgi:hypothetical protein
MAFWQENDEDCISVPCYRGCIDYHSHTNNMHVAFCACIESLATQDLVLVVLFILMLYDFIYTQLSMVSRMLSHIILSCMNGFNTHDCYSDSRKGKDWYLI